MASTTANQGTIYTFYSYKGGVGRSMAMANVAAWLAKWGQRVLMVDWDLEAPGIEKYFSRWIPQPNPEVGGVLDLMESHASGNRADWQRFLIRLAPEGCKEMHILPAGKDLDLPAGEGEYTKRLRQLDWDVLFAEKRLGNYLEKLRNEWRDEYDFVLIDSRTGITDIGGICTIHLPDMLISFFTSNEQSLYGVRDVMERARRGHEKLPVDRLRMLVVPVPSRDESGSEYELAHEWRGKFGRAFGSFFEDWVPKDEDPKLVLDFLKIPYFAYWSFGERVPVLEESDPENPKTLAYAYQPLSRLVLTRLDWSEARAGSQATELSRQHEAEAEKARLETRQIEERKARSEDAIARADTFLKERVDKNLWWLRDRASAYSMLSRVNTFIGSIGLAGLLASAFLVTYRAFSPEASVASGLTVVSIAFLGGMLTLGSVMYWKIRRHDVRARIARAGAFEMERLANLFRASFPGEEPESELKIFVEKIENQIAGVQWSLDNPSETPQKE